MAGNRTNGLFNFAGNFEPQISSPLDARTTVPAQADLLLAATWVANDGGTYTYVGMTVTVAEDSTSANNGVYILLDPTAITNLASWKFVGSGSGQDIEIKDDNTSVTTKVKDIDFVGTGVTVTGTGTGNENITVTIPGGLGSYTNATAMPQSFPGTGAFANIASGTSFSNQTFTEMMNAMLYPTLNPALGPPSSSMTKSPSATYQEIGASITVTLNSTFNRGSISPQYTSTSPFRSGLPNTYNYTGAQVSSNSSTSTTDSESTAGAYTVLAGLNTWTGSVSFDAGVMPKDSIGGDFDPPGALAAGTTSTSTQSITGVYPVFANTQVPIGPPPNTAVKQTLQSMTTTIVVDFASELVSNPSFYKQALDIPLAGGGQAGWSTITAVEQFNTFSGLWDPSALSDWTTSATTHTIQGLVINYTRYTYNGSGIGSRKMRFKT